MTDRLSIGVQRAGAPAISQDMLALLVIPVIGAIGFVLFPDDLAFLTRLVSLALLVLSLDLVTGYCGVATLGHAALFGVAAYTAGNVALAGFDDPLLLLLAGAIVGG